MSYQLMRVVGPGEYTRLLRHADRIASLWIRLDEYTAQQLPVVIVDQAGEIRAGNLLGMIETIDKGIINIRKDNARTA